MDKLIESLKVLLADTFAFRLKSQYYHWNVEGADFVQYHKFLGDLYEAADADVDTIAEHIRALGAYAPGSFGRFSTLTAIEDEENIPLAVEMINRLSRDNKTLHASMMTAHAAAEEQNQRGVVNFIEGLLDANEKTQWMLNSIIKRS
jgi:starvation-inducible DNA-binding protein